MKTKQGLISIGTRILIIIITILVIVISSIAVVFNLLVSNYINTTSIKQLKSAFIMNPDPNTNQPHETMPDMSKVSPGPFNIKVQVFKIDNSYKVIFDHNTTGSDVQTHSDIASALESGKRTLSNLDSAKLKTADGTYYISAKETENASEYLIFYVDVTAIMNFAQMTNIYLLLIMTIAVIISTIGTIFVTKKITDPLKHLSAFSKRIGNEDFTLCNEAFHDRELSELAQSMNHAATQLSTYDKEQKLFFQNASHELRTPLMSIKSYAEGIVYNVMDKESASRIILAETDRLSEMVEDLLTISRIDNIKNEQLKSVCDLRELLASAAAEHNIVALQNKILVRFEFDNTPVLLSVNDKTMIRAFSNLISNALRFAKATIVLTCKKTEKHIEISVEDDGEGISQDDMPHIFERFYKGKNGKHGIGLSIVKSVIEQHNGIINISSNAHGTKFTLFWENV